MADIDRKCMEPIGRGQCCGQPAVAEVRGAGGLFDGLKCPQHALGWPDRVVTYL